MKIKVSTHPSDIFMQSDLYTAMTTAIAKTVQDCSDSTKDESFKRHIKIDLIITKDKETSTGAILVGKVDTVLSPIVLEMKDYEQIMIDTDTGEVKE